MLVKAITYCGQPVILICDGQCNKAWGINCRPKVQDSSLGGVMMFVSDNEVGDAPIDPGTAEGPDSKPQDSTQRLNKWCARECERSKLVDANKEFSLPDWTKRRAT